MRVRDTRRIAGYGIAMAALLLVTAGASTSAQTDAVPAPSSLTTGPAGAPVPGAWDYVRLTPEGRYTLRTKARALPPAERAKHNDALDVQLNQLPAWIHQALHEERNAMDCKFGTVADQPPAPAVTVPGAWAWVKLLPHQRHEFRMEARTLGDAARRAYDAQFAAQMAKLPPWLQAALGQEAAEMEARYGTSTCPAKTN